MSIETVVRTLRREVLAQSRDPVPEKLQGVSRDRILKVLNRLAFGTADMVDAVYSPLDDHQTSWFPRAAAEGLRFCDGASTAHIGCHVGILQRGAGKLDREGRDYWIKPLRAIGAIEPVYLLAETGEFIQGHPIAKSSNSAYRLHPDFRVILQAPDDSWGPRLDAWVSEEAVRDRQVLQGEAEERSRNLVDSGHVALIGECQRIFVPRFLPGYEPLYLDIGHGDRISAEDRSRLVAAALDLQLSDAMPDILLWHHGRNTLWVIEAVTSDGEVDWHKRHRLTERANRFGKPGIGFTTAYWTWKAAAARQGRFKNIEVDTWLWIAEDPGKHWKADPWPVSL